MFKRRREIRKLYAYQNRTLTSIIDAIIKVRASDFSHEEKAIFHRIEEYRQKLSNDSRIISNEVFGTQEKRKIQDICKKAASPPQWCRFHYVLADKLNSKSYLEIGTNLGISGSYLISAVLKRQGKLITMEGHPDLCAIAKTQFSSLADEERFEIIEGLYQKTFPVMIDRPEKFDTIFIDGNHWKNATLQYFLSLKHKITEPAVMVFDDIRWSTGMREAWEMIKQDPDVNYSIDLAKLGIIVIDKADENRNVSSKFTVF